MGISYPSLKDLEKFWSKELLCPKYFGSKTILGQKEFWLKSAQDGPRNVSVSTEILLTLSFWVVLLRVGGWVGGGWVSENGNNAISASMEVEVELSCVEAEAKGKKYGL